MVVSAVQTDHDYFWLPTRHLNGEEDCESPSFEDNNK